MRQLIAAASAALLFTSTAWAQGAGGAAQGTFGAQQRRPAAPARDTSAIPKKGMLADGASEIVALGVVVPKQ